ncbi:hypothetical protein KKA50_03005 [Patescibacteria group bacterium]|nr:hypothetical protein [Patescibacteria group bacterium]
MNFVELQELPLQKLLEIAWKNEDVVEASECMLIIFSREGQEGLRLFNQCRKQMEKYCETGFGLATKCLVGEYEKKKTPLEKQTKVDIPFPRGS